MNLDRIDLSDYLIHFVSSVDTENEDYYLSEMHPKEFEMNGDTVEENILSPFFILRRIIRNCQLISTWSYRSGNRTIYGKYPAVCFTEMPLSEFVRTSIQRQSKGHKISSYGLIFNKKQLFGLGTRPVIYGASQEVRVISNGLYKELDPQIYSDKELYRYVAFNLDRLPYPIDWTHEREWRWPNYAYEYYDINSIMFDDIADKKLNATLRELLRLRENERIEFHGLNLDKVNVNGIGIILKNELQAKRIVKDILKLIDTGKISKKSFGFILYFNHLVENIENLIDKNYVKNVITKGLIRIDDFFQIDDSLKKEVKRKIESICKEFKNYDKFEQPHKGWQSGISFPCLNSNEDKIARVLVNLGYIKVTNLGRYLIDLPILQPTKCMENNEEFVRQILNPILEKELGIRLTYYSVGDFMSGKPISINDTPFYTEPNDDEWNYAHDENDY